MRAEAFATSLALPGASPEEASRCAASAWESAARASAQALSTQVAQEHGPLEAAVEEGIEEARAHVRDLIESVLAQAWDATFERARGRLEALRARQPHAPRAWWASVAQIEACTRWTPAQWRGLEGLPGWAARGCLAHAEIAPGDEEPRGWIARRARAHAERTGIRVAGEGPDEVPIKGWPHDAWEEAPFGAALACAAWGRALETDAEWGAGHALEWEIGLSGQTIDAREAAHRTLEGAGEIRERLQQGIRRKALETLAWEGGPDAERVARLIEERWNGHTGARARDALLGTDEEGRIVWQVALEHPMEALASARGGGCARSAAHEMRAHQSMLVQANDPDSVWVLGRRRRAPATAPCAERARAGGRAIAQALAQRRGERAEQERESATGQGGTP